jgi:hypothetical protein
MGSCGGNPGLYRRGSASLSAAVDCLSRSDAAVGLLVPEWGEALLVLHPYTDAESGRALSDERAPRARAMHRAPPFDCVRMPEPDSLSAVG